MDPDTAKALEAAGWRTGDYGDFLGLTDEERAEVERRADSYLALAEDFPIRPLRSDEENTRAIAVIHSLLRRHLDPGEQDYLDALTEVVWEYERVAFPMTGGEPPP